MVEYPSPEKIAEFNLLALSVIKAKKSDAPKVLSHAKLVAAIKACETFEGDLFDKTAVLLAKLVQAHAFASGNRRTAFIATKYFLILNNQKMGIEDHPQKRQNAGRNTRKLLLAPTNKGVDSKWQNQRIQTITCITKS